MLCERERRRSADDDNEEGEETVWPDHYGASVVTLCDVDPSLLIVYDVERDGVFECEAGSPSW
jgi:hypothetical protein